MRISFVMGPPCAGKSTFIRSAFPNATVIDLYDFQKDAMTTEDVAASYEQTRQALISAIREGKEEIVLEHTLLKAIRREIYIEAVKETADVPITCYVVLPDIERHRQNCDKREANTIYALAARDFLEIPTEDEGFENVYIVSHPSESGMKGKVEK